MTKELTIGGKTINFTANGATCLFYKQFFKKDLLKEITTNGDEMTIASEAIPELAFIMAKQADKADLMKMPFDKYIEWLELFNPFDLALCGNDIFMVYVADAVPTEEPKKKGKGKAKE